MNIVVVIPAYNTSKTIGNLVNTAIKYVDKVIVVNNNSIDNTANIAFKHGAIVLNEINQGQGAATRRGWEMVDKTKYDTIVTFDADGQHNPSEIPALLKPIIEDKADIVIGSRFMNSYKAPKYRKVGINIINYIYNIFNSKKLIDTQSCFRVYNRKALNSLIIEEDGFGFSTELLIKARKLGLRIIEVPVSCIYYNDLYNNSTLNPIKHGLIVAWKTLWWRIKLWN